MKRALQNMPNTVAMPPNPIRFSEMKTLGSGPGGALGRTASGVILPFLFLTMVLPSIWLVGPGVQLPEEVRGVTRREMMAVQPHCVDPLRPQGEARNASTYGESFVY